MTTVEDTIKKADAAIDIILEYDEKNTDCSFKEFLAVVIDKWRNLR